MKIAITGNSFPFGEGIAYGGERMIYYLIQGLSDLGHDIYVFSQPGTNIPKHFIKDFIPVVPEQGKDNYFEAIMNYCFKHHFKFDVYQCNYFGENWDERILETFTYVEFTWCVWCHIFWQLHKQAYNTISCSKVMQNDFLNRGVETIMIHYGLPKNLYKLSLKHSNYAVWLGKIEAGKAPKLAIELAKVVGLKIIIMGPPYNTGCFYQQIAPYLDNENVFWVRGVDDVQKEKIMSKAKVFISSNDNSWKEHFGIVNIEALAMGVPILAFNRINQDCAIKVDEIIEDGVHGFFLEYNDSNNLEEILDKGVPLLNRIDEIDRIECRKQFEKKFTLELMARRYSWLYSYLIQNGNQSTVKIPF